MSEEIGDIGPTFTINTDGSCELRTAQGSVRIDAGGTIAIATAMRDEAWMAAAATIIHRAAATMDVAPGKWCETPRQRIRAAHAEQLLGWPHAVDAAVRGVIFSMPSALSLLGMEQIPRVKQAVLTIALHHDTIEAEEVERLVRAVWDAG